MASNKSSYPKGRRPISNAPGGGTYADKWHQKLDYLENPKRGKPKEIRLVGGIFTIFQHFVRFKRKDGSKSGFYEVCPDFDWEAGEFRKGPDAVCPLCADFQADDLPQELRLLGSFRYYMDAFDITAAKEGRKDVFGVVFTNKYGKNDLAMIGDILGCEIDDPEKGTSVLWHFDEKAQDPKDRVRFYQGNKMPVRYNEEKGLWMMKGGGKVYTGQPTPFDEIVEVKDPATIRADLKRLGLYARLEEVIEVVASRDEPTKDRPAASNWGDDTPEEEAPAKSQKAKGAPRGKKASKAAPPEDEAWGADDSSDTSLESAPSDDAWGDDTSSASSGDEWGNESSDNASSDDAWGDDSGNGKSAKASDDEWGADGDKSEGDGPAYDDSLFSEDGWGDSPSEKKSSSKTEAEDDPSGW